MISRDASTPRQPIRPRVLGVRVRADTRCAHYHSALDVIAIRLHCCREYYACIECHNAVADHAVMRWPAKEFGKPAVLCGACGTELTISEYLGCDHECPACGAGFNPGCELHHHLYFATD